MKHIIEKADRFLAGVWENDWVWMVKIGILLWCCMYAIWKLS